MFFVDQFKFDSQLFTEDCIFFREDFDEFLLAFEKSLIEAFYYMLIDPN